MMILGYFVVLESKVLKKKCSFIKDVGVNLKEFYVGDNLSNYMNNIIEL